MAAAAVLIPRQIGLEELAVTLLPSGDTFTAEVLGFGPGYVLTKIPLILLTQLKSAANDAAAAAAGVAVGQCYYNTTDTSLHTRLT